jgi:hypothetical protein
MTVLRLLTKWKYLELFLEQSLVVIIIIISDFLWVGKSLEVYMYNVDSRECMSPRVQAFGLWHPSPYSFDFEAQHGRGFS